MNEINVRKMLKERGYSNKAVKNILAWYLNGIL